MLSPILKLFIIAYCDPIIASLELSSNAVPLSSSIPARDNLLASIPSIELVISPPFGLPLPPWLIDGWLLDDSEYESSPATSMTPPMFCSSSTVDCCIIPDFPPPVVVLLTVISATFIECSLNGILHSCSN